VSAELPAPAGPVPAPPLGVARHGAGRRGLLRYGSLLGPGRRLPGAGEAPPPDGPGGDSSEDEASAPALAPGPVRTAVAPSLLVLAPRRASGAGPAASPSRPLGNKVAGREVLVVFLISLVLAVAWWHQAWEYPTGNQIGGAGDADEYSWFFSWMPFALGHGLNPLVSTYVNFPSGINLMWNTSVLLPSFIMAPVTVVFGAAFSYNSVLTLAPVLACTFSYLAFRRWADRLPALAGGLVFAFSPFVTSQAVGHLAQVLTASAPLLLILLDRLLVVQSAKAWAEGLLLGVLAWAQLLTGEETLALEAITALIAVAVLCLLNRAVVAAHLRYAWSGLKVAAGSFVVLAAPFLAFQYFGPDRVQDVHPADAYVIDLLDFVVPTNITRLAPAAAIQVTQHFTGNGSEEGAYIGIPLLVFLAVTLFLARKRGITWVALATALGTGALSMGSTLHVDGHRYFKSFLRLPEFVLQKLPFFHNLLPDRFASMMFLGVGLLLALGLNELKRLKTPLRAGGATLVAVGLACFCPIINYPASSSPLLTAFDTGWACPARAAGASTSHPPVVLMLPAADELALRWQAESKFCYVMPSDTGMTGTNSGDISRSHMLLTLGAPGTPMPTITPAVRAQAAADIQALHVSEIVVPPESPAVPLWTPEGQAQVVVWLQQLLGQDPQQSLDPYITYVWKHLPSAGDIASGHVAKVVLGTKPPPGRPASRR
jgi:hypothetical protein